METEMPKKLLKYDERKALAETLPLEQRSVADLAEIIDRHFKHLAPSNERFSKASAMHRGGWVYVTYEGVQKGFHSLSRLEAAWYASALKDGFVGSHFEAFSTTPDPK